MTSFDAWAPPSEVSTAGWQTVTSPSWRSRAREDLRRAALVVVGAVLLGAPFGLLWSWLAPHYTVVFDSSGQPTYPEIESSKAFIGADGSFTLAMVVAGALTGLAAWLLARRSGPWTVVALAVGGALAGLVAVRVGLLPGQQESFEALSRKQGAVHLFLGVREGDGTHLRATWAFLFWPATALVVFLVAALARPDQVD